MNASTARALNALNRAFYAATADEFDATRAHPWPGWARVRPLVETPAGRPLHALDVGCGNGRFGLFLGAHFPAVLYHGLDNSRALLERARAALAASPNVQASFESRDIVEGLIDGGQSPVEGAESVADDGFDLVALFGVLHHIPGAARRRALVRGLAGQVRPGGVLAFAAWRFHEYARFRDRIIPFPPGLDVEANDYLLDWRRGAQAVRYCHYIDDAEQAELIAAAGLTPFSLYRADGESGDMNAYVVLRR